MASSLPLNSTQYKNNMASKITITIELTPEQAGPFMAQFALYLASPKKEEKTVTVETDNEKKERKDLEAKAQKKANASLLLLSKKLEREKKDLEAKAQKKAEIFVQKLMEEEREKKDLETKAQKKAEIFPFSFPPPKT